MILVDFLLVFLTVADVLVAVKSESNCQRIPVKLDDGAEGYCCIFNRNNRPQNVRAEDIVRSIFNSTNDYKMNNNNRKSSAENRHSVARNGHGNVDQFSLDENRNTEYNYGNNYGNQSSRFNQKNRNNATKLQNNHSYRNTENSDPNRHFSMPSSTKNINNKPLVFPGQTNAHSKTNISVKIDPNSSKPIVTTIDSDGERQNFTFDPKNSFNVPHNCPKGQGANQNGDCVDDF